MQPPKYLLMPAQPLALVDAVQYKANNLCAVCKQLEEGNPKRACEQKAGKRAT